MSSYSLKTRYVFGNASRFWPVFMLAGMFAWVSPYMFEQDNEPVKVILVGSFGVLLGLTLRFCTMGIQIDMQTKRIRNYSSYFGIRVGEWKYLPGFKKIVLTSKKVTYWNTPNGISPTFKTDTTMYTIGLFAEEDKPECIIQSESEKLAESEAKRLADLLDVTLERL